MHDRFQLLVFDWDGTLSDSASGIITAMQMAIRDLRLAARDDDDIRELIGLGLEESIFHLYPELESEYRKELSSLYRSHYLKLTEKAAPLFPAVRETIAGLHDAGYLMAVATGKSRKGLDRSLRENDMGIYFHASRTADEAYSKPHPQMIMDIMFELDVLPEQTLMVGDSEYDLQMARNANVQSLAVSYGVHTPERLLESDPLACLDCLAQLPRWLEQHDCRETN